MKYLSFVLLCFVSCKTLSQKKSNTAKYTIDTTLENDFFNNRPVYSIESLDSIFIDSVLVEVNKREYPESEAANSFIRDLNNTHFPFYNCKSMYIKDTLFMEFYDNAPVLSDKIKVFIVEDHFTAHFVFDDTIILAEPQKLVFKSTPSDSKSIAGELLIAVMDPRNQKSYKFSGPFMVPISKPK